MLTGILRVVIEPIELDDKKGGQSWVPAEDSGNDHGLWEPYIFPIGKISTRFHILLEVVPPKRKYAQSRGHVSIDNLILKDCFRDDGHGGTCSASDVRCTSEGKAICVKTGSICDINNDCDDESDELLNCGTYRFFFATLTARVLLLLFNNEMKMCLQTKFHWAGNVTSKRIGAAGKILGRPY